MLFSVLKLIHLIFTTLVLGACFQPTPISKEDLKTKLEVPKTLYEFYYPIFESFIQPPGDFVWIGHNVVIYDCKRYPLGELSLMLDFQAAVDQGFRCLANLGKRYPGTLGPLLRQKTRNILGYLSNSYAKPFMISCQDPKHYTEADAKKGKKMYFSTEDGGDVAMALMCVNLDLTDNPYDHPGIVINLKDPRWADSAFAQSSLFHELFHHSNYMHQKKDPTLFDAVFAAEKCCFPSNVDRIPSDTEQDKVCIDLINKKHGT